MPSQHRPALLLLMLVIALFSSCWQPAQAAAPMSVCHMPRLEVLPFTPELDTTTSAAQLSRRAGGAWLLGAVVAERWVDLDAARCVLTVGWRRPVLYIVAEVAANPCARAHVMQHERGHVQIYEAATASLPQRISALRAGGLSLHDAAEAALLEVRAQHAEHDSDEELATNYTACGRRIPRLVAGAF